MAASRTQPAIARTTLDPDPRGRLPREPVVHRPAARGVPGHHAGRQRRGRQQDAPRRPHREAGLEAGARGPEACRPDREQRHRQRGRRPSSRARRSPARISASRPRTRTTPRAAPSPRSARPPTPRAVPPRSVPVRVGGDESEDGQWSVQSVHVRPNDPEEGDIYADAPVVVFRSTAVLDVTPVLEGTTLTITGAVHDGGLRPLRRGSDGRPVGDRSARRYRSRAGGSTSGSASRPRSPARRAPGTTSSPSAPSPCTSHRPGRRCCRRRSPRPARTAPSGWSVTVKGGDRSYEVIGTHADAAGRTVTAQESAWARSRATTRARAWSGPAATRAGAPTASATP